MIFKTVNKLVEKYPDMFNVKQYQAIPYGGYIEIADRSGNKVKLYYGETSDQQGVIFKDTLAYQSGIDEVCYVSETLLEKNTFEAINLIFDFLNKELNSNEINVAAQNLIRDLEVTSCGYTRRDFLKMCSFQEEVVALIFADVGWASPGIYFDEPEGRNEFFYLDDGTILLTSGMELEDYLYSLYKQDWCEQRGYLLKDVNIEHGINGECYISLAEFIGNELKVNRTHYIDLALRRQEYHVNHRAKIEDYCHAPVTVKEMYDYGYHWQGMIPLKIEDAKALYSKYEVYKLYENGTEATVESFEEFEDHNGLFGIEDPDYPGNQEKELEMER